MADNLSCTVVTPAQTIYAGEATYVGLPGEVGSFGVMKGHEPLVSTLGSGIVTIDAVQASESARYVIAGGYAEIDDNAVIVLADKAIAIKDINVADVRAQAAKVEETLKGIPEGDADRAYYQDQKNWLNLQLTSASAAE